MIRLIFVALLVLTSTAQARQHRHVVHQVRLDPGCNVIFPCETPYASSPVKVRETRGKYIARQMGFGGPVVHEHKPVRAPRSRVHVDPTPRVASQVIGGRPAGCPHAFCGCGASLHLFGRIVPSLNLAANWLRFPRAAPAPKMAAARNHHVMVLEQHIQGDVWLVHDSNSGNHLTRLHARSIAGYTIVDPRGAG